MTRSIGERMARDDTVSQPMTRTVRPGSRAWAARAICGAVALPAAVLFACRAEKGTPTSGDGGQRAPSPPASERPRVLYLPDGDLGPPSVAPAVPPAPVGAPGRCPPEMVSVEGRFCIDRWEGTLVDAAHARVASPYYPPSRQGAVRAWERWRTRRNEVGNARARAMPLPGLEHWQTTEDWEPMARSLPDVVPSGYVSGVVAKAACERAGKRLCREDEWRTACGGEGRTRYPYGDAWQPVACNVFREAHPAALLHDDPSIEHSDPRLNLATSGGKPLLRRTGATPGCASRWGGDAIYDMVGNLDEWIDDEGGVFVGGFYSRSTRSGCDARVSAHPRGYYDYSLGLRCCR